MSTVKDMLSEKGPQATFDRAREVARNYTYELRNNGLISFSEPDENELGMYL